MRGFSDGQKRAIKKRDNDCCQLCLSTKRQRQIHHLFSQSSYPLLANILHNGLTLCEICHVKFNDFCPNGTNSGEGEVALGFHAQTNGDHGAHSRGRRSAF
ncbi:hypothetical protein SAMN05444392_104167 [Seinonella peptonophila]|uniref:HNH endonuclease n=1 Tax=Seinonella peptonophila TaxID=112248 RepID=A0A1M4X770_9BACL|nr:hypothetical protein SAMN05444392_104167 [Seinonella peptonophila]